MIDSFYIESARSIRSEYLKLNQELHKYENELKQIAQLMLDTAKDLEVYRDGDMNKQKDVESVKNYIFSKLDYLESESNKLAKKIEPVNEGIERLKKDELNLYQTLRTKYPNLSDNDIRQEIQKHLVK